MSFEVIGDLFKIYFVWDKHFYLELLRPLERRDFRVVRPDGNASDFILGHSWQVSPKYKIKSDGSKYDTSYEASYTIHLAYKDEIFKCLKEHLKENFSNASLLSSLHSIFDKNTQRMYHAYNYKGCPTHDHKVEKDKATLDEFMNILESEEGSKKIDHLFNRGFDHVKNKIFAVNQTYYDSVRYALRDNESYHDDIRRKYSDVSKEKLSIIESKRELIASLKEEVDLLCKDIGEEHKSLLKESLSNMNDLPRAIKDIASQDIDDMRIRREGGLPVQEGIYIRRAKDE